MLPRIKAANKHGVGRSIPRYTPLLPETVEALAAWLDYRDLEISKAQDETHKQKAEQAYDTEPLIFVTREKKPLRTSRLSDLFRKRLIGNDPKLKKLVNGKWTLKHLRNVAPTLRKQAGMPQEFSSAILGHTERGTNPMYQGDCGEDYLLPLVNLVGEKYFR